MKALFPARRVQRVRHETRPREVKVLLVEPLGQEEQLPRREAPIVRGNSSLAHTNV